jgi:WD40 repeat protein
MSSAEAIKIQTDINNLREQIRELQDVDASEDVPDNHPLVRAAGAGAPPAPALNMIQRRILRGHFGKVYAMHWAADSQKLVSASQDGRLIIWNALSSNKLHMIPLRSSWVMSAGYAPSGQFVACGGLDNTCTVYKLPNQMNNAHTKWEGIELQQHEGYLSCCRFIDDNHILTSSGDSTCLLWDITKQKPIQSFDGHDGDVMSVAVTNSQGTNFVSASVDSTVNMWDCKSGQVVSTFHGHNSDVNSVDAIVDSNIFASGSDDSTAFLYDIRAMRWVNRMSDIKSTTGINSVALSKSARYCFASYDEAHFIAYDTLSSSQNYKPLGVHPDDMRYSCLGVPDDGSCLAGGSWDFTLRIYSE